MEKIPKISFLKKSKTKIGFEIIPLNSIFSRMASLAPPVDSPHRVDFYIILYITKGVGKHYIDFQAYRYKKGSIFFISRGQVHSFEVCSGSDGFLILFTDDFLSKNLIHSDILSLYRLYNYHLYEPVIQPEEAGGEFNNIVNEIHMEYLQPDNFAKEEILRLLLKLLLLKAERIKRTLVPKEKNSEWITTFTDFKTHLEKHYTETRNAKEYAEMMGVSYKHLNLVCKSIAGDTAKSFIDQFIILETKRRLAISDISIKELTYVLGFDEPTNLVKFFKKHTHQSPSQFKKSLTE